MNVDSGHLDFRVPHKLRYHLQTLSGLAQPSAEGVAQRVEPDAPEADPLTRTVQRRVNGRLANRLPRVLRRREDSLAFGHLHPLPEHRADLRA